MSKTYALISTKSKQVENTILAEENFTMPGYTVIALSDGTYCQPGMYWSKKDGLFYQNAELTEIYPPFLSEIN